MQWWQSREARASPIIVGMHALSALLHAMAMTMGLLAIHQSIGSARHPYLFTVYLLQQRKRS
jgi:hypothetical protein